jgi:hypothetical protein
MTHIEDTSGELRVQYIDDSGAISPSVVAAEISNTRIAGLPQMVLTDENVVLAWTGSSRLQYLDRLLKT